MLLFVDQNMVVQEVWNILDMVTHMQQEHKDYIIILHKQTENILLLKFLVLFSVKFNDNSSKHIIFRRLTVTAGFCSYVIIEEDSNLSACVAICVSIFPQNIMSLPLENQETYLKCCFLGQQSLIARINFLQLPTKKFTISMLYTCCKAAKSRN